MLPSGSLELLPSSKTLSIGKVITWSGPATAIGGLLFLVAHPSQEYSFLQETIIVNMIKAKYCNSLFMILKLTTVVEKTTTVGVNGFD